ncbi:hypothetical protein [Luteococcus peritonei]|uniref:TolA protein n=1 Tax=Luteococcus peritonei TaxID=88874 RepID=A0ABW4RXL6_9ACTN
MADTQPRDDHAKQLKQTVSRVKQLRGWVSSDPSKTEELVDALNQATGLRLLSRLWGEAAGEATEAVQASDRLVASRGPVGPYTPVVDAARYFTALTHVATLQLGLELAEAAGSTIGAAFAWKDQLTQPGLADELAARTTVWALLARARGALAAGDLAAANAQADAALLRAREAQLQGDETVVLLEALRTAADARWTVRLGEQSLDLLREAVSLWERWTAEPLAQMPRMTKPHLERLVGPGFALRRDLADRLQATGRTEEALALREATASQLHRMAGRRGEPGRVELALARADQVWGMVDAGQAEAAEKAAEDALSALQALLKAEKPVGQHLGTQLLVAPALARWELAVGQAEAARRSIDAALNRMAGNKQMAVDPAARGLALMVRAEVLDALQDPAAATARAEADQIAAGLRSSGLESENFSQVDQRTWLRARSRGVLLVSRQHTPHWQVLSAEAALAPQGAEVPEAALLSDEEAMRRIDEVREAEARERAVAELREATLRAEKERQQAAARAAALKEAERREAAEAERRRAEEQAAAVAEEQRREQEREQAQAARLAAEQAAEPVSEPAAPAESEGADAATETDLAAAELEREAAEEQAREAAERQAREAAAQAEQAEQAERAERERREQERREQEARDAELEAERRHAAQLAAEHEAQRRADPLDGLREEAHRALSSGDKGWVVASHEALVEALEPVAQADPQAHGRELVMALERLSEAQGWLRGRTAGRRAKQLAKDWQL